MSRMSALVRMRTMQVDTQLMESVIKMTNLGLLSTDHRMLLSYIWEKLPFFIDSYIYTPPPFTVSEIELHLNNLYHVMVYLVVL